MSEVVRQVSPEMPKRYPAGMCHLVVTMDINKEMAVLTIDLFVVPLINLNLSLTILERDNNSLSLLVLTPHTQLNSNNNSLLEDR
jgi:hypothetical protein